MTQLTIKELIDKAREHNLSAEQALVVETCHQELLADDAAGEWEYHNWEHQTRSMLLTILGSHED